MGVLGAVGGGGEMVVWTGLECLVGYLIFCYVAGLCSLKDYIEISPIMHTCRPTLHLLPRLEVVVVVVVEALSP